MIDRILVHLEKLVAFNSTSARSNLELIDYVEAVLQPLGFSTRSVPSEDGLKAGLLASIGHVDRPGLVLSAHTDTVPVDGQAWSSDPYMLRIAGSRAYGRGTTDMKGFIAVCLAVAEGLEEKSLTAPVHLAFSYDEELGCLGAPRLVNQLRDQFGQQDGVIVGEPTDMKLVLGHKGNTALEIVTHGQAGHSSLAPMTVNAIDLMFEVQRHVYDIRAQLADAARDAGYDVPVSTVCMTEISGGTAINIVPAACRMVVEFRTLPGIDVNDMPEQIQSLCAASLATARRLVPEVDIEIHRLFSYPGLESSAEQPFCSAVAHAAQTNASSKVAYGTEAGVFSRILNSPTVVIGPGSIQQAHCPDEYIELGQLEHCATFLQRMVSRPDIRLR